MAEPDRPAGRIADPRRERRTDPVPEQPRWLEVSHEEWEEAWLAVLTFALRVTQSLPRAEDIRQEAYVRLLTTRPWTAEREVPFVRHMLLTASSILKHANKAQHRRDGYEAEWGAAHRVERGSVTPSPEQDTLEHAENLRNRDRAVRVLAELRRRLADFPLELRLIDHAEQAEESGDELETPAELARSLGVPVEEIYRARARIRRYKDGVYDAVGGVGEESDDDEA